MEENDTLRSSQVDVLPQPKTAPATRKPHTRKRQVNKEEKASIRQFHRENPFVTHSHIAGLFGLERSTVSKILGEATVEPNPMHIPTPPNLDQTTQGQMSERSGFIPQRHTTASSIQRALFNWAQQTQRAGIRVTQPMLRQQAANLATMAWTDRHKTGFSGSRGLEMSNLMDMSMQDFRPSSTIFSSPQVGTHTPSSSGCLTPTMSCFSHSPIPSSPDPFNTTNKLMNMTDDPNLIPVSMDDVLIAMNSPEVCASHDSSNTGEMALNLLQDCLQKSAPLTPFDYLCLEHLREKLSGYETHMDGI